MIERRYSTARKQAADLRESRLLTRAVLCGVYVEGVREDLVRQLD